MVISPRPNHSAAYTSFANLKSMEFKKKQQKSLQSGTGRRLRALLNQEEAK